MGSKLSFYFLSRLQPLLLPEPVHDQAEAAGGQEGRPGHWGGRFLHDGQGVLLPGHGQLEHVDRVHREHQGQAGGEQLRGGGSNRISRVSGPTEVPGMLIRVANLSERNKKGILSLICGVCFRVQT